MTLKKIAIYFLLFTSANSFCQEPISVIITGDCNPISGTFNYNNNLNGKYNYINQVTDNETGEVIDFQIGFDGTLWIMYPDNDITNAGFYNENVPSGMLPPNNGWHFFNCDNGTMIIEGGITVSTYNYDINKSIKIYPNPVKETLFIEIENAEKMKIDIINSLGTKIKTFNKLNNRINTSNWNRGVFYIKAYNNKNSTIFKIIKY